jgi:hypothetical protein
MTKAYLRQNIDIEGECCGDDCRFYQWRQGWNPHYCLHFDKHLEEDEGYYQAVRCQSCLDEAQEEE